MSGRATSGSAGPDLRGEGKQEERAGWGEAMHRSTAARRATRLFWGVMGSSLLVVSGVTLAWLLGKHSVPPMTVLDACLMMMRQVWGITHRYVASPPFTGVLTLVLVASGAWAGGRSLAAWWCTQRLLAGSEPYRHGRWPTLDVALATLPHVRRRLRMLGAAHPVACTVGLWRPHIVLSAGLIAALSSTEIGAVLGHEWGHVSRRDPLRLALLRFWSAVLWFLPIVRALAQESARSMEDAADDVAVALTNQPLDLAAALVKTAQAQARPRWSPVPALGGEHMVTERVERLLEIVPARPRRRHHRAWAISALVAACLLGLILLSRQPVAAAPARLSAPQSSMMLCPMDTPQR